MNSFGGLRQSMPSINARHISIKADGTRQAASMMKRCNFRGPRSGRGGWPRFVAEDVIDSSFARRSFSSVKEKKNLHHCPIFSLAAAAAAAANTAHG